MSKLIRWLPVALLSTLLALLVLATMFGRSIQAAIVESPAYEPDSVRVMIFRNGSHPTVDYNGLVVRGIARDSLTTTWGDSVGNAEKSKFVWYGATTTYTDMRTVLVKADVDTLAAMNAVVLDAFLVLTVDTTHWTGGPSANLIVPFDVCRMVAPWTGSVNGTYANGSSTSWINAGLVSAVSTWTDPYGSEITFEGVTGEVLLNESIPTTWLGACIGASSDSIYSGIEADMIPCEQFFLQLASKTSMDVPQCALRFNVTRMVSKWVSGSWENDGLALSPALSQGALKRFGIHTQYNTVSPIYDPFLVVRYMRQTAAGGAGGGGHIAAPLGRPQRSTLGRP